VTGVVTPARGLGDGQGFIAAAVFDDGMAVGWEVWG
jgi:hypothetical protein